MNIFKSTVAAVALLSVAPLVQAQFADTKSLTIDGARRVIGAAVAEANNKKTTGVIAVVDSGIDFNHPDLDPAPDVAATAFNATSPGSSCQDGGGHGHGGTRDRNDEPFHTL